MFVVSVNSPKSGLEVEGIRSGGTSGGIAALVIDILNMKKRVASDSPKNVVVGGGIVGTNDVVGEGTNDVVGEGTSDVAALVIDILNMKISIPHYGLPACILTLIMGADVDVVPRLCKSIVSSDTGKPHELPYCDFMSSLGRSSLK